jgi:hypothetical protein
MRDLTVIAAEYGLDYNANKAYIMVLINNNWYIATNKDVLLTLLKTFNVRSF